MLEAPPGTFLRDRTLNAADGATVVPAEKLEPGCVFLSNFKTKHSRPREKGLERSVETDTGGVKKDTCGVEQTARLLLLEILQRAKVPVSLPAATQCLQ
jgi:hypothetical protein